MTAIPQIYINLTENCPVLSDTAKSVYPETILSEERYIVWRSQLSLTVQMRKYDE